MKNTLRIDLDEKFVRKALIEALQNKYGTDMEGAGLKIKVKSKQNYRSEWEEAAFRAQIWKDLI